MQAVDFLFGDTNSDALVAAIALAVISGSINVSVCVGNVELRRLIVSEFIDNEAFTTLEVYFMINYQAVLIQIGVRECLIVKNNTVEYTRISSMLFKGNILETPLPKSIFFYIIQVNLRFRNIQYTNC